MLDDIIKVILCGYIVFGSVIPLSDRLVRNKYYIITGIYVLIFVLLDSHYIYSLLLIGCGVVFTSQTFAIKKQAQPIIKQEETKKEPFKQTEETKEPLKKEETTKEPSKQTSNLNDKVTLNAKKSCNLRCNSTYPRLDRHVNHIDNNLDRMQTNVFDKINMRVFYNSLGVQHNIQGIHDKLDKNYNMNIVDGYDKTVLY